MIWMDLEIVILSEVGQTQKEKYDIAYMWNLKKWYKWTYLQNRSRISDVENKLWLPGVRRGGINWKIGIDIYALLYIKMITNKDLLCSVGNSTQYSGMTYMGKESKKACIYIYV